MDFSERLDAAMRAGDPAGSMYDYKGQYISRSEVIAKAEQILAMLDFAGAPQGAAVGIIVRNRPLHAIALLALMAGKRLLTSIYSIQSPEAIAEDITTSRFAAVIADVQDWTPVALEAARKAGAAAIRLDLSADPQIVFQPGLDKVGAGPFRTNPGEPGLEILSSGTTGKPKRVVLPFSMMMRMVESAKAGRPADMPMLPEILTWPFGGIGGMCNLVASTFLGKHMTLLDKFNVPEWVEAVKRHRPIAVNGTPAVARMVLDAKIPKEDLASIQYFTGGGAPMTPELQDEFEATYGINVIWAYGATEFCGTVISWSPELHTTHKVAKRGSMGVALPGVSLRVTDMESGEPLPPGQEGYLEAIVPEVGEGEWIKTTDIAVIDEDGFVFHRGRGDGAILRGGFKVLPEKIFGVLQAHPAILDAGVIGLPDARLGAVPVAAVELRSDAGSITEEELREYCRVHLVVHHVPTRVMILDTLPRTTSLKVDLGAIRKLFEAEAVPA